MTTTTDATEDTPSPPAWRRRLASVPWVRLGAESVLIVVSILAALAVDEWQRGRARAAQRALVLANLTAEIEANRAAVEAVLPYHRTVLEAVSARSAALATGDASAPVGLELLAGVAPRGLQPPDVHATAWETAVATDVLALLDFATTSRLARLYDTQRSGVERTVERVQDVVLDRATYDPAGAATTLQLLHALASELVAQEVYLGERYAEVLTELARLG